MNIMNNENKATILNVPNANLSKIIEDNIDFVERYLDKIETIDNDKDREIIYRELCSITVSAIEALAKVIVDEINNRCLKLKCKEKCSYRKWKTKEDIAKQKTNGLLKHLNNTRLFYFSYQQLESIKRITDLRNYIHISKYMEEKKQDIIFDKELVIKLLDFYYTLLSQYEVNYFYFNNQNSCLKELDENEYDNTLVNNKKNDTMYYEMSLRNVFDKIVYNEKLNEDDKWVLSNLNKKRCSDGYLKLFAVYVVQTIYRKGILYNDKGKFVLNNEQYIYLKNAIFCKLDLVKAIENEIGKIRLFQKSR